MLTDELDGAIDVLGCLGMEGDVGRPAAAKSGNDAVHGLNHQVHIDGRTSMPCLRSASQTSGPIVRFGT